MSACSYPIDYCFTEEISGVSEQRLFLSSNAYFMRILNKGSVISKLNKRRLPFGIPLISFRCGVSYFASDSGDQLSSGPVP